jgi:O-antigen/teichoic acid export membrane protein
MAKQVLNRLKGRLARNIATNYLAVLWMGGLTLALIPWYTRVLDPEQWGLVAVCIALQGFISLLDAGLTQIMPRDVARGGESRDAVAHTFHVFARAYLILGSAGFIIGQIAAPWIAQHWLKASPQTATDATFALRVVLTQFLFQFVNNAHVGYWNGTQAQATANVRQCFFGTTKHVGAIALVQLWQPTATAYLTSFALFSVLECLTNRRAILVSLTADATSSKVTRADLTSLAHETGVLAVGVLLGLLISQIDRIVLSGHVEVAAFGRYVIVANLGLAFMQLQHPLVRAFLPKIATSPPDATPRAYRQMAAAIILLCVLPCALAAVLAPQILHVWIGKPIIVEQGALPLRLILAAVALNGLYQIIYQQLIVKGLTGSIFRINLMILVVAFPVSLATISRFGIAGGGMTWLTVSTLQLLLGWSFVQRASA